MQSKSTYGLSAKKFRTKGFTLVELSIVIVIIGLIVVAVTAGQSLVKSGRLQAQIQQLTEYSTAFNAFILQYNAIPGDMKNASSYWSGAIDGDGNGYLNNHGDIDMSGNPQEVLTLFQHLLMAQLVKVSYFNLITFPIAPVNYVKLAIDPNKGMISGSYLRTAGIPSGAFVSDTEATLQHKAVLYLNVAYPAAGGSSYNDTLGTMTAQQAQAIDTKIDDGIARKGKFKANKAWSGGTYCLTGVDGDYLLTDTTTTCQGEYILK